MAFIGMKAQLSNKLRISTVVDVSLPARTPWPATMENKNQSMLSRMAHSRRPYSTGLN